MDRCAYGFYWIYCVIAGWCCSSRVCMWGGHCLTQVLWCLLNGQKYIFQWVYRICNMHACKNVKNVSCLYRKNRCWKKLFHQSDDRERKCLHHLAKYLSFYDALKFLLQSFWCCNVELLSVEEEAAVNVQSNLTTPMQRKIAAQISR